MKHVRSLALFVVVAGCTRASAVAPRPPPPPPPTPEAPAAEVADPSAIGLSGDLASYAYGKRTRRDPNDLCETIEENLSRAEHAIVTDDRSRIALASSRAWDGKTPPKYLDLIDRRYALTRSEKAALAKNGFVVPARLRETTYAWAVSYTVAEGAFPPVAVLSLWSDVEGAREFVMRSTRDGGPITVELLDHHRVPVGKGTLNVGPGWKKITVKTTSEDYVSVIRLRQGDQTREVHDMYGTVNDAVGGMKPLDWEAMEKVREKFQKKP